MRVTAVKARADESTRYSFGWLVRLDGEPVKRCVTFDTDEGWVDCMVVDEAGHIMYDPEARGPRIVRRFGVVTAVPPLSEQNHELDLKV
jgi:hypothetical protein